MLLENQLMDGADAPSPSRRGIWTEELLRICFALFALLLLVIPCVHYVHAYGVNVPFLDEWFFLQTYKDWQSNQIGWLDIITHQHNVHRIGVAYAFELVIARISGCDSTWQMYFFVFCRFLTALVLLDIFRAEREDKRVPLFFGVLLGMQLFSLRQWENLLWGFQPCIALSCLFFAIMLWLLERPVASSWAFCGAAVSSLLATFSFASGLLSMPIGLLTIVSQKRERGEKFRWQVVLWTTFCALATALYFWHFQPVSNVVRAENAGRSVSALERCLYGIACIGNAIGIDENACLLFGLLTVLMVAVTAFIIAKSDRENFSRTGAALCLYGLGFSVMTALGRCEGGWGRAVTSRYSSLSCLVLLGVTFLVLRNKNVPRFLPWLVGLLIAYGWGSSALTFGELGKPFKDLRQEIVHIVFNWELFDYHSQFALVRSDPRMFDSIVQYLRAKRLSLFKHDREQPPAEAKLSSDPVVAHASMTSNDAGDGQGMHFNQDGHAELIVSGWAALAATGQPLLVDLLIDDRFRFPCQTGADTTFLATALKLEKASKAGFAVIVRPGEFTAGKHVFKLRMYTIGGNQFRDYGPIGEITVDASP
jgi:hypothetical protein